MTAAIQRVRPLVVMAMMTALVALSVSLETLNVQALMNTDQIFSYANILIVAFGGLILMVVGFQLAKVIIRFVINLFANFSI